MKPSYFTQLPGVPDSATAIPGMAYFAGTGPHSTTCGQCEHRNYMRTSRKEYYDEQLKQFVSSQYRHAGCAMYRALTGKYGVAIDQNNLSCKYFERKVGGR